MISLHPRQSRAWWLVVAVAVLGVGIGTGLVLGAMSAVGTVETNTIAAAAVDHLSISPAAASVQAGQSQTYSVHAIGAAPGNTDFGDVSSNTTFTISGSGTCTGTSCSATVAGSYTVTAHYWGLTVTSSLTVTNGPASQLVFTTEPGSDNESTAGDELSTDPVVTVEDQYNNAVVGDASTVTLSVTSGTPTSGGPGAVAGCQQSESNGVVNFSGCEINAGGNGYKLHAVDGSLTADSSSFNVSSATPDVTITNPNPPSSRAAGSTIAASNILAQLSGTSGTNYNQPITFVLFGPQSSAPPVCGSGGTILSTVTPSGDGTYQSSVGFTPSTVGNYWWYVSTPGDSNNGPAASTCGVDMTETVVTQATPMLKFVSPNPPASSVAGTTIPGSSIQAQLTSTSGTNDTAAITFKVFGAQTTAPTSCASGGSTLGTATPSGNGTYPSSGGYTPTVAGKYWWYASSPSNANDAAAISACGASMAETIVGAAPGSKLTVATPSRTTTAGVTSGTITVERLDPYNNLATNGALTVTLSTTSSGGQFRNPSTGAAITTVTIPSGESTASFVYNDTTVGTPTITAADHGLVLTSVTQQETITSVSPQLAFVSGSISGTATASATLGPLTIQRQDQYGNPITSGTSTIQLATISSGPVSFALSPSGPSISSVTISGPGSSATFYYGDTVAGSPTITASDPSNILAPVSQTETIVAGLATSLAFATSPQSLITELPEGAITVQRQDQFGNPTTSGNLTVNLGTSTVSGQFLDSTGTTPISTATIPDGSSSASFTYQDAVGSPTITASTPGSVLASATQTETVTQDATTVALSSNVSVAVPNQIVTLTATAASVDSVNTSPTGNIEFINGSTLISQCGGSSGEPISTSGTATCATSLSAGTDSITAQYLGDPNFLSSPASSATSVVVQAPTFTLSNRKTGNWNAVATWTSSPSGTITSAKNSCAVTGVGTAFTTQMAIGTLLYNGTAEIGPVGSIASDTSLTLSTCSHAAVTGIAYSARRVPTASDAVSLVPGYTVTVSANVSGVAASLALNSSQGAGSTQLKMTNAGTLAIAGNVTLYPSTTAGNNSILSVAAGTMTIGGSLQYIGLSGNAGQCLETSITTGSLTISGDLDIDNSGGPATCSTVSGYVTPTDMDEVAITGTNGVINVGGAISITNPSNSTVQLTSTATGSINFDGAMPQTVTVPASTSWIYSNLYLNNTSASGATLGGALTASDLTASLRVQSGIFNNGGYAIAMATSKTFQVAAGATFNLTGSTGMVTGTTLILSFASTSTVDYAGTSQTVAVASYGNLTLSGSGTVTMPSSSMTLPGSFMVSGTASATLKQNLTVDGNASVGAGATFNASSYTTTVLGSFTNSGTFYPGTGTVSLSGSILGTGITFNNLTLGTTVTISEVTGASVTVNGTLALGANILSAGDNVVILNGSDSRVGATSSNGYVDGTIQLTISSGSSTPTFDIGNNGEYAPVSLSISGASAGGSLAATSTVGQDPNVSSSVLSQTSYINRYWTLAAVGGLTVTGYNATFTFANPGDLTGSPNTATLNVEAYSRGVWSEPSSLSSTSTSVTGVNFGATFGQYACGN